VKAPNGRPYDLPHRLSVMLLADGAEWRIRTLSATPNPRA